MTSSIKLEVHSAEEKNPQKWRISLPEEVFRRFLSQDNQTVDKVFAEGSLFSPLLFGKFFDPSDAFPLWEFEADSLLSNLRNSGKSTVDWFQTDQAYVLKAEVPGSLLETGLIFRCLTDRIDHEARRLQHKFYEHPKGNLDLYQNFFLLALNS
ncbi:hypothetical protein SLEP1_g26482 [Rubroshorea leprosula]|uniref:Uncharacterized protein n=1 Tax=Rubroshorea leprosula TaxID=152421 RepID=A0AAV5JVU0_9ROSI|nr:hypothetical protein SLEP1_g26482 [Rubroshorea leprosula]